MRIVFASLLLAGGSVVASGLFAQDGSSAQPFSITIKASPETVRVGEEARVHVTLTNISGQDLVLRRSPNPSAAEIHYTVRVYDKNRKDAPETEYGRHARLRQLAGSDSAALLKPGEKLEEDSVLSTLVALTSPGEYEVQLSRPVSDDPKAEVVKSNIVTIAVLPKPEDAEPK
jgi:hypothetical protein